jgi:hypothetical protein
MQGKWLMLLALFAGLQVKAQIVNIESKRIQSDSIRRSGSMNFNLSFSENNNRRLFQVSGATTAQIKSKSLKSIWLILASGDLSRAQGSDLSNSGFLHLRYNYKFSSLFRWEAFQQVQYNQVLGFSFRSLTGMGPRFKFLKSKKLFAYIGTLLMYEYEQPQDNGISIERHFRQSSYVTMNLSFEKAGIELVSTTYYQPGWHTIADYRLLNESGIDFRISKVLSFRTGFTLLYDSRPVEGIEKRALRLTQGITITL